MNTIIKASLAICLVLAGCGSVESQNASDQPTITKVEPDHGPTPGGATITLTGTKFQASGDVIVLVGGRVASSVMVTSDTTLTFVNPPGTEGELVDVTVSNANGFASKPDAFTYNLTPHVLSISPVYGKSTGGSTVTITGRGFQSLEAGAPKVTMAGGVATSAVVMDDKTIIVTTGPAASGTAAFTPTDVVVANANGTVTLKGAFQVTTPGFIALEQQGAFRTYHIDLATGAVNQFGTSHPRTLHGCAVNMTDNKLYCQQRVGHGPGAASQLVTWDPLTNVVSIVGTMNDGSAVNKPVNSLTFIGNTAYGIQTPRGPAAATGFLTSINPSSGAALQIGAAAVYAAGTHNAVALKDGATLYGATNSNGTLDTIAIATGTRTAGPTLSGGNNSIVRGLMLVGSTLYLADYATNGGIFTVNTTTGVLTRFATLPIRPHAVFQAPPSF